MAEAREKPAQSASQRPPIQLVTTEQGPRVGPYIFGKTLGTGSTGKVKLAKNLDTDEIVAIKIVRKDYLENRPSLKMKMRREISVLKVLSHPNLMSLIDVFEIETHLFLVMEFVDGLELFEYLVRRGALPLEEALTFFQQIICGLEYCHNRLICHRDLKPENLLLDRNYNIKIADFGMTSLNRPGTLLETSCGSPHYCDPMVVSGEKYDGLKADIWSCGVILYAMVTGRLPFDDDNIQRLLQKVQMGQYHLPSDLPKDLRDLIRRMLTVDPSKRISLAEIKEHSWFKSRAPRNWIEDNFVAPTEPVEHPDAMVVRSLMDLGWGDASFITAELAKPGESMEKVFYTQLKRHPMFRQPEEPASPSANSDAANAPAPYHGDSSTNSIPENTAAGTPGVAELTPEMTSASVEDGATTPQLSEEVLSDQATAGSDTGQPPIDIIDGTEVSNVEEKMAAVSVNESTGRPGFGDGAAPKSSGDIEADGRSPATESSDSLGQTGGLLKRQSSLLRLDEKGNPIEKESTDEKVPDVKVGNQKSWFRFEAFKEDRDSERTLTEEKAESKGDGESKSE